MILLEALVVLVAAALLVRVTGHRAVRVELRAHPLIGATAFLAGAGVLALLAVAAWRSDAARHAITGAIALCTVAAIWRGAPRHGSGRGLPPGSLSLATSLDAVHDPQFYRRAAARWGPVFKMRQVHRPVVCIADLELAHALLRTHEAHLGQSGWAFNRLVPRGYLEYMRGATHAAYRETLGAAFAATHVAAVREVAGPAARRQLAALAAASRGEGADPEPFLLPVAMASLLHAVLGVAPDHPRAGAFVTLVTTLIRPMELHLPVPRRARETYAALVAEVRALGDAAVRADGSVRPSVLAALVQRDARALDDETVAGNLVLMVKEGSIMVRGLLRWVLRMHCDHPAWGERLRALAGDAGARDALARRFVLETLRLHESRYLYRTAERDLTVGRYRIPRGWLVRVCVGEAHERADRFPDPLRFDPARFDGDPLQRTDFAPFGRGTHACLGADLTLEVARAFLLEVALGHDVRTVRDGPPWRINRHWGLWRPSRDWRVVVTPHLPDTAARTVA